MTERELAIIAFHEAAHACIGLTLGLPVAEASLEPNEDSHGRVTYTREMASSQRRAHQLTIAAGPAAEMKLTGSPMPQFHYGDNEQLNKLIDEEIAEERRHLAGIINKKDRIARILEQGKTLVDQHWRWIDNVAEQLYLMKRLTAAEVKALRPTARRTA